MNQSVFLTVGLPVALAIIMLGLGLSLTLNDFKRVLVYPKAVVVALLCQGVLLPAACFVLCLLFRLPPELAVGMMLLAASPGGTSANLYSHLAHGDVALNITLTAINSVIAIVTMPFIVNLSLMYFFEHGAVLPLQFDKVLQVFAIVMIPVMIGMFIRHKAPDFSARMDKPVRAFSLFFLIAVVVLVTVTQWGVLYASIAIIGGVVLTFNVLSLAVGYWVPRFTGIDQRQSIAIGMEIGIHNGTLAIAMAMSPNLLDNPQMALPAAVYGGLVFFTAAVFGVLVNRGRRD
ncbi:bile acid:sodium symporter family protein [Limnobacter humi]|uniref:Bile acid:sodium symporter family protein n=1 Tax=Limnobacter humi TaxID=1778671 RepID=A0ABT1WG31_9BURK|nr:bile acid:sodium symporter family protein [Limnobacter humi]MCQ8896471.1 bile acid:sodium symporter family protein [Limnobacter humi]